MGAGTFFPSFVFPRRKQVLPPLARSRARHNLRVKRSMTVPILLLLTAQILLLNLTQVHVLGESVAGAFLRVLRLERMLGKGPLRVMGHLDLRTIQARQRDLYKTDAYSCPVRTDLPVFVALTTIPSRVDLLKPALESLLGQSYPVDVLLSIPKKFERFSDEQTEELHLFLTSSFVTESNRIHVLTAEEDAGPGTKLLYPLSFLRDSPAQIVVVDDDQDYASSLVCDILAVSSSHEGSAITRRSRIFAKRHCRDYKESSLIAEETMRPGHPPLFYDTDLVMGTSGYGVKTSFFDDSIFSYAACPESLRKPMFLNDDIWISGHLKRRGVQITTSLSGFRYSNEYATSRPEKVRQLSRPDGLWADKKESDHRTRALQAFYGLFCVPRRLSMLQMKKSVCKFDS